jgi:hypothetical protein
MLTASSGFGGDFASVFKIMTEEDTTYVLNSN